MSDDVRIVVWDPSGEFADGSVIDGPREIAALERAGVAMLPVERGRAHNAVEGYFRRGWGVGWAFRAMRPERGCPMLLHCATDLPWIYWCARILKTGSDAKGTLRLTTDTSRTTGAFAGGLSAVDNNAVELEKLGPPNPRFHGWVVHGRSKLSVSTDGYLALSIYGIARDVSVLVSAVSQCKREVQP